MYMVQGNHDPAESWRAQITLPENVHVFSSKQVQRFPLMVNNLEIGGIYGMSCGEGNETTNFAKQYKAFESDDFSIAVMHGTVGAATENSEVKINTSVGPCNVSDLTEAAMDYWAIGHIHKRQIVNEEPYVVYAGNPQGLHKKDAVLKEPIWWLCRTKEIVNWNSRKLVLSDLNERLSIFRP